MSPQKLVLEEAPLNGVSLIEASAGTGKTFTITALYLRLIVGHECKPLSPEEILVVTFTKAATEELRGRIRNRLRQAVVAIEKNDMSHDPFVFSIISDLDKDRTLQRLKDAVQVMDLAAIYTIHGFAQKVLSQYTVESHVDDEFQLILEQQEIENTAVNDVWRTLVYPMSDAELSVVLDQWRSPQILLEDVRQLIHRENVVFQEIQSVDIEQSFAEYQNAFQGFVSDWETQGEDFFQAIASHPQANGNFVRFLDGRKQKIESYIAGSSDKDIETVLGYFDEIGMQKSVKKKQQPIDHALIQSFAQIKQAVSHWHEKKDAALLKWKIRFVKAIRRRIDELKLKMSVLSADDLLKQVWTALNSYDELGSMLRQQFPVAMVDEFQDTDSIQYQVFSKLYNPLNTNDQIDTAFFMIGDPKQAIYKFRGADIFTYIQAKTEVEREYSLENNYRSAPELVEAVNDIFTRHDSPFLYDKSIPFYRVGAGSSALPIRSKELLDSACIFQTLDITENDSVPETRNKVAAGVAEQISALLNSGERQKTELYEKQSDQYRSVSSKDIAILVRSAKQARLVKKALDERNIACVFNGQESLYESEEAQAIYELMLSIHSMNEQSYRNAIANPIWMLSLSDLWGHLRDEHAWEQELDLLYECQNIWKHNGIMPMLIHWLHTRNLAHKWFAYSDGERRVTNYLHMAELLQEQAAKLQSMQALLTWCEYKLQDRKQSDEATLRLESDDNLVNIVTVHSSKGLEYPIVFLPFTWSMSNNTDIIYYDEDQQVLICDLQNDHEDLRKIEQLAEEVRLFYVGMTRASSQLYLTVPTSCKNKALSKQVSNSPLFHVLCNSHEKEKIEASAELISGAIDSLIHGSNEKRFAKQPLGGDITPFKAAQEVGSWSHLRFDGQIKQPWFMSSFSSLVRGLHAPHHQRFNFDEEAIDADEVSRVEGVATEQEQLTPFTFPKGAHAGNFLHNVFEDIEFDKSVSEQASIIHELLLRYGIEDKWLDTVTTWSDTILQAPLLDRDINQTVQLSKLTNDQKSVEMEFYFPVAGLQSSRFNQLLEQYPILRSIENIHALNFDYLKGMLKGFIDLTFEWQGRYYVLDYKSNYLGDSLDSYHASAMEQAMSDHRYDVQLVIYTLALHRLLKLSLPNYDYDQHIGGGFYLFLRGVSGNSDYGQFYSKPDRALIETLDELMEGNL